ncbi:TPA: DUF4393 domain-containing protein, partial [Streptococcus agalactiae]|nr:DUF4393 domain-containing protein [Streptococcus agalactiae]
FCNLFASLIASSMDKRKTVKPIYSSILKEMSSSDAKLLQYFFSNRFIFEINIQSSNHLFSIQIYITGIGIVNIIKGSILIILKQLGIMNNPQKWKKCTITALIFTKIILKPKFNF